MVREAAGGRQVEAQALGGLVAVEHRPRVDGAVEEARGLAQLPDLPRRTDRGTRAVTDGDVVGILHLGGLHRGDDRAVEGRGRGHHRDDGAGEVELQRLGLADGCRGDRGIRGRGHRVEAAHQRLAGAATASALGAELVAVVLGAGQVVGIAEVGALGEGVGNQPGHGDGRGEAEAGATEVAGTLAVHVVLVVAIVMCELIPQLLHLSGIIG